ncbi:hypothetical protein CPK_ORF00537 [Chlamydia pneumoniae LPCoLN]|uniref:hypothetical protein n=1 Tax=Chlamydia pneumoniae TaxID=83558 RepID=UPI0001BD9E40|nr:hypothetical protein [Chlamydia pneumoniae]ACZ33008.1 hypothetical protein CPK_ORF00537 [Chlamydia pneumoniae LPCoLN]ETR79911.1 hypothetical protein X556_0770 [Chlamydia pneumoniae B21]
MAEISTPSLPDSSIVSQKTPPVPDPDSSPDHIPTIPTQAPFKPQRKKETPSSIVNAIAFAILAFLSCLGGVFAICLGCSLEITMPLFILTAVFIAFTLLYFIHYLEKPKIPEPLPTPLPPKLSPPPSPTLRAPTLTPEIPVPAPGIPLPPTLPKVDRTKLTCNPDIHYPSTYDPKACSSLLKQLFSLDPETRPEDRKYSNKLASILLRSKEKPGFRFHCFKGHFSHDKILNKKSGAVVISSHSSMDFSTTLGRAFAVTTCLQRSCWEKIKNNIPTPEKHLPIGSCVSGPWDVEEGAQLYTSHLIVINPPTLETLIKEKMRRAVTLKDFSMKEAFTNLVLAYLQCFDICIEHNLESVQLEVFGLNNLSADQEEFTTWESCCHLALLESVRILLASKEEYALSNVSVNSIPQVPLQTACRALFLN